MQAKDVMTSRVVTVSPETPVEEIAKRLLERRISAVPVVDPGGRPIGIVSEGDLMRRPEATGERRPSWWLELLAEPEERAREYVRSHGGLAHEVMTRDPVTVEEDAPLDAIAALLEKHRIKRVPVVRDGKLVGIVSRANLIQGVGTGQRAPPASADDRALREQAIQAIEATGARGEFVNVVVSDGIVHLWGTVLSVAEREAVQVAASRVAGAKGLESHLGLLSPGVRAVLWAE